MGTVMVVDGGGRGHALARAYLENESIERVIVAPGNEGMRDDCINSLGASRTENKYFGKIIPDARGELKQVRSLLDLAYEYKPDLIDVAQDDAIALGAVDALQGAGFQAVGPARLAAQIEWDKIWAREFMTRHGIQTPEYRAFTLGEDSLPYTLDLLKRHERVFFKAAGLYGGKGVVDAHDEASARAALEELATMGNAARRYLIEGGLIGEEFSYHVIVDGEYFLSFPSAQDNKRAFSGDKGKNTGGMGANAPAAVTCGLKHRIEQQIIKRTVEGLAAEGRPYRGILCLGGMYDASTDHLGVIEFSARWNDPECQVILPGVAVNEGSTDYCTLVQNTCAGSLHRTGFFMDGLSRVCIVGAARGYPEEWSSVVGKRVRIDYASVPKEVHFLSAGVRVHEGKLYVAGGRVFSAVASGKDVIEARRRALHALACCSIEGNNLHYRADIAWRDLERAYAQLSA